MAWAFWAYFRLIFPYLSRSGKNGRGITHDTKERDAKKISSSNQTRTQWKNRQFIEDFLLKTCISCGDFPAPDHPREFPAPNLTSSGEASKLSERSSTNLYSYVNGGAEVTNG
jgi:hypothetical protein